LSPPNLLGMRRIAGILGAAFVAVMLLAVPAGTGQGRGVPSLDRDAISGLDVGLPDGARVRCVVLYQQTPKGPAAALSCDWP
jgi:hypothetical protein